MNPEKYDIKTLTDILMAVTSKNQEAFLIDFSSFIRQWAALREAMESAPGRADIQKVAKDMSFVWIDDGKHGGTVNLEIRFDGTEEI